MHRKLVPLPVPAHGFTLIELLVVIAIIGILAALVTTQLSSAQAKSKNSKAMSVINEMSKAIEVFKADEGSGFKAIDSGKVSVTTAQAGYSGGVYRPPIATLTMSGTTAVTNTSTSRGDLTDIFGGTSNVFTANVAQYGLIVNSTPSSTYTYSYLTESVGPATTNRANSTSTVRNAHGTCYVIFTTLDSARTGSNDYFVIDNGTSESTDTTPTQCNP